MVLRYRRLDSNEVVIIEGTRHIRTNYLTGEDGKIDRCEVMFHHNGDWQGAEVADVDSVRIFTATGDLIEVR